MSQIIQFLFDFSLSLRFLNHHEINHPKKHFQLDLCQQRGQKCSLLDIIYHPRWELPHNKQSSRKVNGRTNKQNLIRFLFIFWLLRSESTKWKFFFVGETSKVVDGRQLNKLNWQRCRLLIRFIWVIITGNKSIAVVPFLSLSTHQTLYL